MQQSARCERADHADLSEHASGADGAQPGVAGSGRGCSLGRAQHAAQHGQLRRGGAAGRRGLGGGRICGRGGDHVAHVHAGLPAVLRHVAPSGGGGVLVRLRRNKAPAEARHAEQRVDARGARADVHAQNALRAGALGGGALRRAVLDEVLQPEQIVEPRRHCRA